MGKFDFDTIVWRDDFGSAKWSRRTDEEKAARVVPMSVADMEFPCAPAIASAVERAARHSIYGYTDNDDRYRDAVAGWMARRHGWAIQRDWIVPENGVVPAVSVAVRAFTQPGDPVLLQSPGYYPFQMMIEQNGRVPLFSPLHLGEDDLYHMDFDDLRAKAADPRVKLMILCSPHNPVGRIWTPEELREVAAICKENGIFIFSDEIHFDLELYGKHTVLCQAAPEIADRCVIATATSKTFNLAGLQLANMIIPGEATRVAYIDRLWGDGYSNASYFGYHATIAAYTEGDEWLDALLDYVRGNVVFFAGWFAEHMPMIRVLPVQGTYLVWTDWRALGMDDAALERFVRGDALLVLDEGTLFGDGGEGFMRFNLALPRAELEKALARLLVAARAKGIV